jgi:hypothetical protein
MNIMKLSIQDYLKKINSWLNYLVFNFDQDTVKHGTRDTTYKTPATRQVFCSFYFFALPSMTVCATFEGTSP